MNNRLILSIVIGQVISLFTFFPLFSNSEIILILLVLEISIGSVFTIPLYIFITLLWLESTSGIKISEELKKWKN
jgi:hypothetical protein